MAEDQKSPSEGRKPANDNRPSLGEPEDEGPAPCQRTDRVDRVVLDIARLIGRQMAREQFEARRAANDNGCGMAGRPQTEAEDD